MIKENQTGYLGYLMVGILFFVISGALLCHRVYITIVFDTKVIGVAKELLRGRASNICKVEYQVDGRSVITSIEIDDERSSETQIGDKVELYYNKKDSEEVVTPEKVGMTVDNVIIGGTFFLLALNLLISIWKPELIVKYLYKAMT